MDQAALQPYIERATKAEQTIDELKKQIAYLEAIAYSKNNTYYNNVDNNEQKKETTDNVEDRTKEIPENAVDKTKKIEEFLSHRPKPNEVGIDVNISSTLYETIRHLEFEKKRDSVHQLVEHRPSQEELKTSRILEFTELAPSLQATAHTLEREMTKDKLERKVEHRPSPEAVGINLNLSPTLAKTAHELEKEQLKDKFTSAFHEAKGMHAYSHDPNVAPYSNIAPSLQPTAAQLEHHQRRDSMDKLFHAHLLKEKGTTKEADGTHHDTQTAPSQMGTRAWVIERLKEIRADVLALDNEKKSLQEAIAYRDLLLKDCRRSLHWCIKVGNLKKSLEFFCNALGMKVLRHEEFSSQCQAKCNGDYDNPWSKTMISYGDEHTNFALELTYNYGTKGYRRVNDLRYIGIYVLEESLQKAQKLGYQIKKIENKDQEPTYQIIGPDDVCVNMKIVKQLPKEPFWSLALNVTNIKQTFDYWVGTLNLHCLSYIENTYLRCAFGSQVPMEFFQLQNNEKLDHGKAQGRIAFTTRLENGPHIIYKYIKDREYKIQTNPVTLPTPGKADVTVVILQDPDDYEICFVGEKGFDDLCTTKPGDDNIDWKYRQENGADQDKGKIRQ